MTSATSQPLTVAVLCPDMFFASSIEGTAQANGVAARCADDVASTLRIVSPQFTKLVIVDLDTQRIDPAELMAGLPVPRPRVIGFFPHLRLEVRDAALSAGFDAVLTRGQFSSQLVELLRGATESA